MTDATDAQAEVLLDALIGVLTPDSASCPSKQRRPYLSPRRRTAAHADVDARHATPQKQRQQPDAEDRILSLVEERAGLRMALTTLTEMGGDDGAEDARKQAKQQHPGLGSREAPAGTPPSAAGRRWGHRQQGSAASPSFAASPESVEASDGVKYVQVVPSVKLSESVVREREAMQHLLDSVRSRRTAAPASGGSSSGVLCYESSIVDTSQTAAAVPAAERFVPARDAFILSLLEKLRVARSRAGEGGGGAGDGRDGSVRSSPRRDAQAVEDARAEAVEEKVRAERLAAQNGELARRAGAAEAEAETLRAQTAALEERCSALRAEAASKEAAAHEGAAERDALRVLLQNAEDEMVELLERLEQERKTLGAAVAESDDDAHDASTTAAAAAAAAAESAVLASELEEARRVQAAQAAVRATEVEEARRAQEAEAAVRAAEAEEAQRVHAAHAAVSASELEEARRAAERLAARLFEAEKERDALRAERAALSVAVDEERAALRGARAEADRLRETLAAREVDVEGLRREAAAAAAQQHEGGGGGGGGEGLLAQLEDANGRARGLQAENARLKVEKAKSLHATDTERQHMLQTLNEQYGIIDELRAEAVRLKAQAIESPARAREAEGSPVSMDGGGGGGGGGATIMMDLVERNSELERELDDVRRKLSGVCVERIKDESVLAAEIEALGAEKRSLAAQLASEALSHQQAAREVFALKPTAAQLSERSALDGTEGTARDGIVQEEKAALQPLVMLALRGQSRVLLTTKKRRASRGGGSCTSRVSGGSDYAR